MIPTDKEIEEKAKMHWYDLRDRYTFTDGAKWMRDQIGKEEPAKAQEKKKWKASDVANLSDREMVIPLNDLMQPKETKPSFGEWQLCPKCNGSGVIGMGIICDICEGEKIIARPLIK